MLSEGEDLSINAVKWKVLDSNLCNGVGSRNPKWL